MNRLSMEEMGERLSLKNPDLIRKILGYAEQYWQEMLKVKTALDDKAQKGFQMAALCLTVFISLASLFNQSLVNLEGKRVFFVLFALGSASLLASALCFFLANRKTKYFVLSHLQILSKETLVLADDRFKEGVLIYERNMARHFIDLGLEALASNGAKGAVMRKGEAFFITGISFLVFSLLPLLFFIAF